MKKTQKLKLGLSFMAVFGLFLITSNVSSQTMGGGEGDCKWKRSSCGLFGGTYEACLTNGDGNACTCGDVTRNC